MPSNKDIIKEIKRYGLKPSSARPMTLLGASCVVLAYTKLHQELFGFSYQAVGAIGNEKRTDFLVNDDRIAKIMARLIHSKKQFIGKILNHIQQINQIATSRLNKAFNGANENPQEFLKSVITIYPNYLASLGAYSCFWRFLGDDASKLPSQVIKIIASRRDRAALLYPKVENTIRLVAQRLGKQKRYFEQALSCLTISEMQKWLESGKLPISQEVLRRRAAAYVLLAAINKKEMIIAGQRSVQAIHKQVFKVGKSINSISGQIGYSGYAHGRVYNLETSQNSRPPKDFILVVTTTHPKDLALIKKSRGIIANEGGILSHAAIVARELKKPCVVGTKVATRILKDGDLVEVDATKGRIRILKTNK